MDKEIRFHLERAIEEHMAAGMSREEATYQARRDFGPIALAKEEIRDTSRLAWLSGLGLDTRLGVRMLRKHWGLTLIGGLAMAAAMTMGSSVFNLISALQGTSVPLEEGDRVVVVQPFDPETGQQENTAAQDFERWRAEMDSLVDVGAFRTVNRDLLTNNGIAAALTVAEMSAAGFDLARVNPLTGRFLLSEDERFGAPPVVVIGYDTWRSTFVSDPAVVGQQLQLDGVSHTVVGVMPEGFRFPISHQYWTSLRTEPSDQVTVFARLAPGATLESAQAELELVGLGEASPVTESSRPLRPFVRPYIDGLTGGTRIGIAALLAFVLPLLLIPPCTNIGVLIYARTVARQGEFAARAALGASRGRIISQIFIEVLVLAAASAGAALVLTPKVAEILSRMVMFDSRPFWVDLGVSHATILYAATMALVAALITGAIPALRATGRWQLAGLHALNRSSAPKLGRAWTAIVVAQVALSVAVLPTAAELAWATLRPAILGPGFPIRDFLTARLVLAAGDDPAAAAARFSSLRTEVARQLEAEPGVRAVTMSESKPFEERNLLVEADSPGSARGPQSVAFNRVDAAFFDVFGIPLVAGRGFEPADHDPQRGTVLVNRSFVGRVLAGDDPLGRVVRVPGPNAVLARYEIVGLVENQFAYSDQPTIYRPMTPAAAVQESEDFYSVHFALDVGPALPSGFATRLRNVAAAIDPASTIDDVQPLNEIYWYLSVPDYIFGSIPALVALAVLLFAMVGIYTWMSFAMVARRREIGIRAALGASPRKLVAGVFQSVFVPLLIGGGLGGLTALVLDLYLAPLLFTSAGGRPLPWSLPAAEAFVLLIGVVALLGPVLRTLRIDATEVLREN
jgi:predicted permease